MRIFAALIGLPGYYRYIPFTFFHEEWLIALQFYAAKYWLARVPFHFHIQKFRSQALHIHILGICGTFMGGIAAIAREAGHKVLAAMRAFIHP